MWTSTMPITRYGPSRTQCIDRSCCVATGGDGSACEVTLVDLDANSFRRFLDQLGASDVLCRFPCSRACLQALNSPPLLIIDEVPGLDLFSPFRKRGLLWVLSVLRFLLSVLVVFGGGPAL